MSVVVEIVVEIVVHDCVRVRVRVRVRGALGTGSFPGRVLFFGDRAGGPAFALLRLGIVGLGSGA